MEFDAKFVHFMWDSKLNGVKAFCANDIDQLKHYVESNDTGRMGYIHFSFEESDPFVVEDDDRYFKFVYFDPYYQFKRAFEEGKKIEVDFFGNNKWVVITDPTWDHEPSRYRIKKEDENYEAKPKTRLVTNRELSEWLNLGMGEYLTPDGTVSTVWTYKVGAERDFVDSSVRIRKWDSDRWLSLIHDNLYH